MSTPDFDLSKITGRESPYDVECNDPDHLHAMKQLSAVMDIQDQRDELLKLVKDIYTHAFSDAFVGGRYNIDYMFIDRCRIAISKEVKV